MDFHIGKIYKLPKNLFFYKPNQPRLWIEYCKKVKLPENINQINPVKIIESNSSCIEYCKNIVIFPENDEISKSDSDDDSWVDMKKIL